MCFLSSVLQYRGPSNVEAALIVDCSGQVGGGGHGKNVITGGVMQLVKDT